MILQGSGLVLMYSNKERGGPREQEEELLELCRKIDSTALILDKIPHVSVH